MTPDDSAPDAPEQPPLLSVVRGNPTPAELAALTAVVAAGRAAGAPPPRAMVSMWTAHHRRMRPRHRKGPGMWRATAWPQ